MTERTQGDTLLTTMATDPELISNITDNLTTTSSPENEDSGSDEGAIYFDILIFLANYIYPVIVIGGCLSNALGLAVMRRKRLRCLSVCVYLSVLAISDSLVLALDFINNWVGQTLGHNLIAFNTPLCVLYRYSFEVFFTLSAWLVVAITIERLIVVIFPLKAKTLTSVTRARIISFGIFLAVCVYKLYNVPIWEVTPEGECDWRKGWEEFHINANMPLNFTFYSYVPSVVLLCCNVIIVVQIWRQNIRRSEMTDSDGSAEARKITVMVLVISFSYIILTVPLSAYYTIQYADEQFIEQTPQMAMGEIIILLVGLSNHGINLYLYVIVSNNFREELLAMLGLRRFFKRGKKSADKKYKMPLPMKGDANSSTMDDSKSTSVNTSQTKLSSNAGSSMNVSSVSVTVHS